MLNNICRLQLFLTALFCVGLVSQVHASISGQLDLRVLSADDARSWVDEGLGKQRFDNSQGNIKLGQAIVEARGNITDTLSGKLVVNGYDDRQGFADITEAYVQWKPLPIQGYRIKTKVGAFFPPLSLENNGTGWTNPWMVSTSAINTWVGEELRTLGGEISFSRPGQMHQSPHDFELLYSIFTANDPAGGLLSWRGWSVGDRITGLSETLPFPDMPGIYGSTGLFKKQGDFEKPFYELDHHYGFYSGASYGYNGRLQLRALHYNNRGDPLVLKDQQWAWETEFDQLALRLDLPQQTTLLSQYMEGYTKFGVYGYGVDVDFNSWYLLLSKALGKHRLSARYDKFETIDRDDMPGDNNSESGNALALTWLYQFTRQQQTGVEYLRIRSRREGREYLSDAVADYADPAISESSLQVFYRVHF